MTEQSQRVGEHALHWVCIAGSKCNTAMIDKYYEVESGFRI